ncbi:hypothetical protein [Paraburkholderia adhaesiva]|uniref:hypothetical protein n=1 Tax=Paraburkholderia adhaesiva TaxID=2883244 RepID=UPI001F3F0AA5|nr:hypothetical protein [Paraburkholderia adhaesiva]
MSKKLTLPCAVLSCFFIAGCGGGGSGSSGSSSASTGSSVNTAAPLAPVLADNVLVSNSYAADGVFATINQAGIVRAFGTGSGQNVRIAAGSTPLSLTGNTASASGWLVSGSTFEPGTVTLSGNADGTTYTIAAQATGTQASDSSMEVLSTVIAPTPGALAGQYGIVSTSAVTIDGTSLTGTYGNTCMWSATLSPNAKTIDVTDITFRTAGTTLNPNAIACAYAGKTYTGTAFLLGPSAAYPKGAFDIIFDDSATSPVPATLTMYNFIKQ